ncbi:hypothetical protein BGZ63DRAFT_369894 [Mariannaea sp. PMI_226]|nr:hypothetical protein BGZ63DRAFT_369894 [Mariannaea sp. PMI_226]
MNSKNWNDRADKELFFTILSVKNIGVISGSEWTTIGNHMRSLGYGFTNEGCRQHFQGLRRAQSKAETNGALKENARRVDPTLNPITRRPGPGRGRPRKHPLPPVEIPLSPSQHISPAPMPVPGPVAPQASSVMSLSPVSNLPNTNQPGAHLPSPHAPMIPAPAAGTSPTVPQQMPARQVAGSISTPPITFPSPSPGTDLPQDHPFQSAEQQYSHPEQQQPQPEDTSAIQPDSEAPVEPNPVSVEPPGSLTRDSTQMDAEGEEDEGQPDSKRPRLSSPDPNKEEVLDDEAVLALAAHSGPADPFPTDFTYGEA